jgi:ligand-binding SRPBCC domain-containing protein
VRQALEDEFPNVEWMPMRDLPETEYANVLRRSHVYMTTGKLEGENLSVKEAWASGALVVGFHGFGASLMMKGEGSEQNSVVVLPNGDDQAMVREMRQVLTNLSKNRMHYRHVVENAQRKVDEISTSDEEQAQFITDLLTAYRFGFPFKNDHLWTTVDNKNILEPVVRLESDRPTGFVMIGGVLIVFLLYRMFASRNKKGRKPGLVKKKLAKDD